MHTQHHVVVDTTKVRFFKQITTPIIRRGLMPTLLLTPQRYDFSSKSQHISFQDGVYSCCCWHHKGTIFQANHNTCLNRLTRQHVVVDTTKVRFFKQITTRIFLLKLKNLLLLTPQRYDFSSKSQHDDVDNTSVSGCCWHHKGTIFQANHNTLQPAYISSIVVVDTTKVRFFKQITTKRFV